MAITSALVELAVTVIERLGLPGVFLLMLLESTVVPIPSEGVMPFAGFLSAVGTFPSLLVVTAVATVGSLAGSLLSYEVGRRWGRAFLERHGRWFLLTPRDIERTDRLFQKHGALAVLVGRLLPGVRHVISLPAGAARMRRDLFLATTAVGAFAWNGFLAWLGARLGANWEEVKEMMAPVDLALLALIALAGVLYLYFHLRRPRKSADAVEPTDAGDA